MRLGNMWCMIGHSEAIIGSFLLFDIQKPPVRFELTTPGLQDQCSNPWAMEASGLHKDLPTIYE